MPIVVEVKSKDDYAKWVAEQKKKAAAAADDPNKVWDVKRPASRSGETGVQRQLRRLPPGERQGRRRRRVSGARRLQGRQRTRRTRRSTTVLNGAKDGKPTAMPSWKAALRHRHRRGHHLHAQQLGQQDRRGGPAVAGRGSEASSRRADAQEHCTMSSIPHDRSRGHDHAHDDHGASSRRGSCAGSRRPTTRTSARCTCGSRSRCSSSAAAWRSTIRAELFEPGLQIVNPEFFNSMTTLHGLIMIFGAIMPAAVGFANWHDPDDDRRAGHGVRADEQLELLAAAARGDRC